MKYFFHFFLAISLIIATVKAHEGEDALTAFKEYKMIDNLNILVPTVVNLPLEDSGFDFAVLENETLTFQPYLIVPEFKTESAPKAYSEYTKLVDSSTSTFEEFDVSDIGDDSIEIVLTYSEAISTTNLSIFLDEYVAMPNFVEIRIPDGNNEKMVLAKTLMDNQKINFPETKSNEWIIKFWYGQPLRITEMFFGSSGIIFSKTNSIRFLAKPEASYNIYHSADRPVNIKTGESGDLENNKDVLFLDAISSLNNPDYEISDIDLDGVPDIEDNCVNTMNAAQTDINSNGRGDACDDYDRDSILNSVDNCTEMPNYNQNDEDGDGIGDFCDDEESRITEKYPWLVWAAIGSTTLVVLLLFYKTVKK